MRSSQVFIAGTEEQQQAAKQEIQRMIGTIAGVGNEYREAQGGVPQWNPMAGMRSLFNGSLDLDQLQQYMQIQMQISNPNFYQNPAAPAVGEQPEGAQSAYPGYVPATSEASAANPQPEKQEEAPPGMDDNDAPPGMWCVCWTRFLEQRENCSNGTISFFLSSSTSLSIGETFTLWMYSFTASSSSSTV